MENVALKVQGGSYGKSHGALKKQNQIIEDPKEESD